VFSIRFGIWLENLGNPMRAVYFVLALVLANGQVGSGQTPAKEAQSRKSTEIPSEKSSGQAKLSSTELALVQVRSITDSVLRVFKYQD
jgi:hypothetical protein